MIQFFHHRYSLQPMNDLGALANTNLREGALLKVVWPNGLTGYADLFPWPELGDAGIEDQLEALAQGKISGLVEQSIWLAKKDAALRRDKINAYAGISKVKNHYLISDFRTFNDSHMKELRSAGFTTLKIKVGRDPDEEVKFISRTVKQNPVMVRLDFNSKGTLNSFRDFILKLGPGESSRIEYVEDPFPWNSDAWAEGQKMVPLAIDHEGEKVDFDSLKTPPPFKVVVIKPARQDVEKAVKRVNQFGLKMVVTSSLDHPVGVAHAMKVAADLKKFNPNTLIDCGCLTLKSYKPNEFTNRISVQGPFLNSISGTGIGFDDLFEKVPWVAIQKK